MKCEGVDIQVNALVVKITKQKRSYHYEIFWAEKSGEISQIRSKHVVTGCSWLALSFLLKVCVFHFWSNIEDMCNLLKRTLSEISARDCLQSKSNLYGGTYDLFI